MKPAVVPRPNSIKERNMGEPEDIKVEEEEQPQEAAPQAAGFSIGKLIEWLLSNLIPVIIAVVLSTVITFVIVRTSISKKNEEIYKTVKLAPKPAPLTTFPLDEFRINSADIDEVHYIRVKMDLGYEADKYKKLPAELGERKYQLRDIVLKILNSKQKQDIDEELEKERLKDEIIKEINNVLTEGEIEDVYYEDFVIS
jgi:flagellar FliL protein